MAAAAAAISTPWPVPPARQPANPRASFLNGAETRPGCSSHTAFSQYLYPLKLHSNSFHPLKYKGRVFSLGNFRLVSFFGAQVILEESQKGISQHVEAFQMSTAGLYNLPGSVLSELL
ncbi:hypothetical protein E2C01_025779 [Portunus trituberculatus]|uniref:Uncharacterized protein n=1 Tax=Portunus trituberculatus TaxID=210409 RepID=A0A5B7EGD4_PORTR|nr:hypothetical protein [Portunus trituberculatus]